jgi:hypothetical protein
VNGVRRIVAVTLLVGGGAALLRADSTSDQLESNRRAIEKARANPEQYERMLEDLKAFLDLSPETRARLRQLDTDLNSTATDPKVRSAFLRYAEWFNNLPDELRRKIEAAPTSYERLRLIKEIREQQWVDRLPKAKRDQVNKARGDERVALIQRFRQEEKKRRQEWQFAAKYWDELVTGPPPKRAAEISFPGSRSFVEGVLIPRLSDTDKKFLHNAEGKWPDYPRAVVELADRYVPLPGEVGPKKFDQLPQKDRAYLTTKLQGKKGPWQNMQSAEGHWPDYPLKVMEIVAKVGLALPEPLGPCKAADFNQDVQRFIDKELIDKLSPRERNMLRKAENNWPLYPRTLMKLAADHRLTVPGMLPGPNEYWAKYRSRP